jgi:hypothetical protein
LADFDIEELVHTGHQLASAAHDDNGFAGTVDVKRKATRGFFLRH